LRHFRACVRVCCARACVFASMRACMGGQAHTQKGHTTCVGRDCFQATFAVCAVCSLAAGALCVVLWWFIRRREAAASSRKHSQDDGSRDPMY
jgi:hypothetical protein